MSVNAWAWAAMGLMAGIAHGVLLWRSARRPAPIEGLFGMLRVVGVGAMLLAAALSDGLLPAAAGWGLGFPSAAGYVLLRGRHR